MSSRREKNQFSGRRKRRPHIDRILIFLTGTLVLVTLALYIGPRVQPWLSPKPALVEASVVIEAGKESLDLGDFLLDPAAEARWLSDPASVNTHVPGYYPLRVAVNQHTYDTVVKVSDTTAPTGRAVNRAFWLDEPFAAADFVEDVQDATSVEIAYARAPDLSVIGDQPVDIVLTDLGGNQTVLTAVLTLYEDTQPPLIEGVESQTVFAGSTVAYRQGVTVSDNRDVEPELIIDNSQVNLRVPGTYPVHYIAADKAGNKTQVSATITVVEPVPGSVDPAVVDDLADQILTDILTPDMTPEARAEAIYHWTRGHIRYVNESDKSSWINAAHHGITEAYGDCFNYFATAKILLTRAGIESIDVIRTDEGHFWSLINLGYGWYHFDTTPRVGGGEFFMLTDAEITAYSDEHRGSHVWDPEKYPATPEARP